MSFVIKFGKGTRLTSRIAKLLSLICILCILYAVHAQAAPTKVQPFRHVSIWAAKWAAAHPQLEAAYQSRLHHHYWYRPSQPSVKIASTPNKPAKVATKATVAKMAAKPLVKTATAKLIAKHSVGMVESKIVCKPTVKTKIAFKAPVKTVKVKTAARLVVKNRWIAKRFAAAKAHAAYMAKWAAVAERRHEIRLTLLEAKTVASHASQTVKAAVAVTIKPISVVPDADNNVPVVAAAITTTGAERQRRAAESDEASDGDVTLDFVDADISDVLKALAVETGANIVSSADVKGSITVALAHVTLEQSLDMVARLSGFQYAKIGSTYVVGTTQGIAAMNAPDTAEASVTDFVPFTYSNSDAIMKILKDRYPDIKMEDGTSIDGSKDGAQLKALILSGDPTLVAGAKDLISQIDSQMSAKIESQDTVVYRVRYASISDLISILGSLDPSLVVTPGPAEGFNAKAPSAAAAASSSSASGVSSGGGGSGSGSSGASQANAIGPSILLLTGTDADIAKAQQLLAEVDTQPAQINYSIKVTELDINKQNNLGLNWDFSGATTRIGEEADNIANPPATLGDNGQTNLLSFGAIGRTAVSDLATVSLDAAITDGDGKLLADPNISAIDGQPAQAFIGDTVNYVESITQTTTGQNITTASVQVGVILRVTGKVTPDGYITLNVHPEVSEITGYLSVPGGGSLPQVASRYADTTVRVKNGETIAIGGLIQENDTKNVNKVPGLGDIPFLGKLFQDNQVQKQRTEVVFLLTTKVASE